jgi:alanyl-tRNA synthetase
MKTQLIKKKFLEFFESKGHIIQPSSPTIPHNDPTLLFVNAGMNPFKDYFLGISASLYPKIATAQKCIRVGGKHNDLDNVGHTSRHLTFFEMLGNFSFGNYFKKEAIAMAFSFTCDILGVDKSSLFVSVYEKDLETFELWKQYLPEKQICFMGKKDNYWSMGDVGPNGPCTELYFDRGKEFGSYKSPAEDPNAHRYMEFWNLVFMQFSTSKEGLISDLPSPCIDTGMGLERMAALLNGKESVFETNVFISIIDKLSSMTEVKYKENKAPFHVVADHLRSLSFAIADGAAPSNSERGYVLRKILRRAVRYGKQLGIDKPFLADLFPVLLKEMGEDYNELVQSSHRIQELLTLEEESFHKTLARGGNILHTIIEKALKCEAKEISGKDAFTLKDTFGFPIEEICLLAKDYHLDVHLEAFSLLEAEAKEKSKKTHKTQAQEVQRSIFPEFLKKHGESHFLRNTMHSQGTICGILHNGVFVNTLTEGQKGSIILDTTPFYAEMGGQRGDSGILKHHNAVFEVQHCSSPYVGVILHEGVLTSGTVLVGEPIDATVEKGLRVHTEKNHTATHMLHYALEKVLGGHIRQAGSYVCEHCLRLDFTHHKKVEENEIKEIETLINHAILAAYDVEIIEMSYEDVKKRTDIKQLFGEKYSEKVRMVSVGDFSKELCGGTHIKNTREIGLFRITKESSVANGVRRIEAVTSKEALAFMYKREDLLKHLCSTLGSIEQKVVHDTEKLIQEHTTLKANYKKIRKEQISLMIDSLLAEKKGIQGHYIVIKELSMDPNEFTQFATELVSSLNNGMIILANTQGEVSQIHIQKTKSATALPGAKKLLDEILSQSKGTGGGSEWVAKGSTSSKGLSNALSYVSDLLTL